MMCSFHRRVVLVPVLVLLVAAWVVAFNPQVGRKAIEVCDPEAVEELLEQAEEVEQELLLGLSVEMGLGCLEYLLQQRPCGWGEVCCLSPWQPLEHLLGCCSISRAPPRK